MDPAQPLRRCKSADYEGENGTWEKKTGVTDTINKTQLKPRSIYSIMQIRI